MRRSLLIGVGGYLALSVLGHALERAGLQRCDCRADCWCKRPGLSLFRWVAPFKHRLAR